VILAALVRGFGAGLSEPCWCELEGSWRVGLVARISHYIAHPDFYVGGLKKSDSLNF
jgi:hypothetical protein